MLAAGAGSRLGDPMGLPKALRDVGPRAMYLHSLRTFDAHDRVDACVLVYPAIWEATILEQIVGEVTGPAELVAGGATRGDSVRAGLGVAPDAERVLVHDAARPFISAGLVGRVLDALDDSAAVVPAVPVVDTIKRVQGDRILETVDRASVRAVQTPQGFHGEVLRRAYDEAAAAGVEATDDAALVERIGIEVRIVEGEREAWKITTARDLAAAEASLATEGS